MIYEKRLRSLPALRRELERLDGDAGVRLVGRFEGRRCLAFITRFGSTYTVLVYSAKGTTNPSPGAKVASKESDDVKELVRYLEPIAGAKVDAYSY